MSDNAYWDDDYSWDGDSLITWDGEYDTDIITVLPPVIKQPPTPSVPTILSPKSKKIESWDKWATTPQPTQAKASLSIPNLTHVFAFNPDTANWSYQENITSMDTIGGRVTQLLSIQLTGLTITGRAGSRKELQRIATNLKEIMGYHTNTLNPAIFKVPSRKWNFVVYLMDMSNLGWDVTSTSYPYQLQFAVEDDITGIKTKQISSDVINNLQKDIGYDKGHHGGNAQEFYSIIETITKPRTTVVESGDYTGDIDFGEYADQIHIVTYDWLRKTTKFPGLSPWQCEMIQKGGFVWWEGSYKDAWSYSGSGAPPREQILQPAAMKAYIEASVKMGYPKGVPGKTFRTNEEQINANNTTSGAATPGNGPHEKGMAIDLANSSKDKPGLLDFGWEGISPYEGSTEVWHVQWYKGVENPNLPLNPKVVKSC